MASRDLQSRRLIIAKGWLFLGLGIASAAWVVVEAGFWWKRLLLLGICIWAFCRAYYFAFYVLQHYVDPGYRYSGLLSLLHHRFKQSRELARPPTDGADEIDPPQSGQAK